jgi:hypothetical protein
MMLFDANITPAKPVGVSLILPRKSEKNVFRSFLDVYFVL